MKPVAPVPHVCRPWTGRTRLSRALERLCAPFVAIGMIAAVAAAWVASRTTMAVGVIVEQSTRPAPSDLLSIHDHILFLAGITERGDTAVPVEIRSLSDYHDRLGDRVSYGAVYDQLATFFAEGGTRAYVARVVGGAATTGVLVLQDRGVGPAPTLNLAATSPGAWSTRVSVQVADGAVANTFTISVYFDGAIVEQYPNLPDPATAVAVLTASRYVRATNAASAAAPPANNPAVLAATPLSAGADDRASVVAATYVAALARFDEALGTGDVAIPGQTAANVGAGLIAHARTRNRLALVAPASGQSVAQAEAAVTAFLGIAGSEYAGLVYPWIKTDDGVGGTRLISPEGYAAAAHARGKRAEGPWRAPAGEISRARSVLGVERVLTQSEIDELNDRQVIPVVQIAGSVQLYGWRSLSLDVRNFRLLNGRDVMNTVAVIGKARLLAYVFGTVDGRGHFQLALESEMRAILEPMVSAGGLYERIADDGTLLSPGYTVDASNAINTPDVLALDEVRVDVALRVSPVGELIRLRLTKVAFDAAL